MTEGRRILWLILIMMAAVTVSTAVAITVLYRTAFEQGRAHLIQTAEDQAHFMDAVARFDQKHNDGESDASETATLSQIETAFNHYPSGDDIAEITVAQRLGDRIVYLVTHGRMAVNLVEPIPFDSKLAEPMRRALSGDSGSMIGLDYRGVQVLAAYHPVSVLNAGVVAKMDLAQLRAPFLRGAGMVIDLALVLVTLGTVLFVRLTNPMVRHLTETEQRYQRIFRGAPVPIWELDISGVSAALDDLRTAGVTDLNRHLSSHPGALRQLVRRVRIKEANASALNLFGAHSERQFIAWFEKTFVPAALDLAADKLQALWEGREALLTHTVAVNTLDGRGLTVILSMVVPSSEDGYHSVPVSALDVTPNLNLRRREDELALILASAGEGIFGMDKGGTGTFVNRAALRILGYREEKDLLGRDMHELIHHSCRNGTAVPAQDCPVGRACCQNSAVRLEDEVLWRADGTSFPAEYSSNPMLRDGAVVGTVVTFTDITDRKARDAQLVQSQKMEVVGQHTGRFLRRVTGEGIDLVLQRDQGPLPLQVDRQQLENVLLNLAINARDAMPAGGTMTIAAARQTIAGDEAAGQGLSPGNYVVVSVSDIGAGMSPEVLRRAVEPFYSTKPMGKGSGFGLSTALGFAQQSGGDLSISSAPGQGTTVRLFLPEAAPAAAEARPGRAHPPVSITVLVVDDERRMRRLASRILSELGYRVLEAENAADAARLLENDDSVALLFTDVVMPDEIDGRTLGQWARLERPAFKVLLTSGFPEQLPEEVAPGIEVLPFLSKPYSKEQLQQAVETLLHGEVS